MRDLFAAAYAACEVGAVGWARPDRPLGFDLEKFQSVILAAEDMESDGKISILTVHRESQSGEKLIDAIQFRRLK